MLHENVISHWLRINVVVGNDISNLDVDTLLPGDSGWHSEVLGGHVDFDATSKRRRIADTIYQQTWPDFSGYFVAVEGDYALLYKWPYGALTLP